MFYSYVQNSKLRWELRIVTLVAILFIGFLLVMVVGLSNRNSRLEQRVVALEAGTAPAPIENTVVESYADSSIWQEVNTLKTRVDLLDSRLGRFVILPEGSNDLGGAMEQTLQWQSLVSKTNSNEVRIGEVDGRVSGLDWSLTNEIKARFPSDHSNLSRFDQTILKADTLVAKVDVFETLALIDAGSVSVVYLDPEYRDYEDSEFMFDSEYQYSPKSQESYDAGYTDFVPVFWVKIENGYIRFTYDGILYEVPIEAGQSITVTPMNDLILITVVDPVYEAYAEYLGYYGTGELELVDQSMPPLIIEN